MKVLVSKLPSGGFASTLELIDLLPLNYGQLLKYASQGSSTPIEDLIWDIDNLIASIPDWEHLSSFDVYVIIAYRKLLTLNLSGELTLSNGQKFGLRDVEFTDLDKSLISISSITLGKKTYKPSIKNMGDFYKVLKEFVEAKVYDEKLAIISSFIGISPKNIQELTTEDIVVCESLYPKIISQPKVEIEGGAEVILAGKSSELFQNLLRLSQINPAKIQFSEIS